MPPEPRSDPSPPRSGDATPSAALHRGMALMQAGELAAAEQVLREVVREREDAECLALLASLRLRRSDPREAVELCARAVQLRPSHTPTWLLLGRALAAQGRWEESAKAFEHAARIAPTEARAFQGLGRARLESGRALEAVPSLRRAAGMAPESAAVQVLLGRAYQGTGHSSEARKAYRRALELDPRHSAAARHLGHLFAEQGDLPRALEEHRRATELGPEDAAAHSALAGTARRAGEAALARSSAERALALDPDDVAALEVLAWTERCAGKLDEAAAHLRRALELDEGRASAYYELARTGRLEDVRVVERALVREGTTTEERATLEFASAEVLARRGDDDEAFARYAAANALLEHSGDHDPRAARVHVRRIVERCSAMLFDRRDGWGDPNQMPVFLLGNTRAGAALVEHALAAHPNVAVLGEHPVLADLGARLTRYSGAGEDYPDGLKDLGRQGALRMAREYLSSFERPAGPEVERVIDRARGNALFLGLAGLMFPRARVICVRRHPVDACLADFFAGPAAPSRAWSHDLEHLAQRQEDVDRLLEHWRKVLPLRFLDVDYATLSLDPRESVRRLLSFLELRYDDACVAAQSNARPGLLSGEPSHTRAEGFWQRYEAHLGPLARLLPPEDRPIARAG